MSQTFQLRRGTTAEWVFANPILQAGEMGYETSTNRIKIGTGVDPWSSLIYVEASANSIDWSNIDNKPTTFSPASHASSHETGGTDALTPASIGAAPTASPTFTGDVTIPDKIIHSGDSDTAIRFPAADTFSISTAGVERVRVDSSGNVGIGIDPNVPLQFQNFVAPDNETPANRASHIRLYESGTTVIYGFGVSSSRLNISGGTGQVAVFSGGSETARFTATNQIEVQGGLDNGTKYPGYSFDGDSDSGFGQFGGANTISAITGGTERMKIDSSGNVGINAASPTAKLDINADTMRLRTAKTPASSSDTGNAGDICWDSSYLYICTAPDTWRRIAHSTW